MNPFAGIFALDDSGLDDTGITVDASVSFGGALGYAPTPSWEFSAAYGLSPVTWKHEGLQPAEDDANVHVYYGAASYLTGGEGRVKFLATGGVGGITFSPENTGESSNDLIMNFGGGLRWASGDRFALQATVRDHVQLCKEGEAVLFPDAADESEFSLCPGDDMALHHLEASGGLVILF